MPQTPSSYVHRAGRTARAGKQVNNFFLNIHIAHFLNIFCFIYIFVNLVSYILNKCSLFIIACLFLV